MRLDKQIDKQSFNQHEKLVQDFRARGSRIKLNSDKGLSEQVRPTPEGIDPPPEKIELDEALRSGEVPGGIGAAYNLGSLQGYLRVSGPDLLTSGATVFRVGVDAIQPAVNQPQDGMASEDEGKERSDPGQPRINEEEQGLLSPLSHTSGATLMVAEVYAGLTAFKAMFDMARGLKDINDAAIRNGAVIELQEQILSAQQQQSKLIERIRALEAEVASFETWETEKERYELKQLSSHGVYAYAVREHVRGSEPAHWICPDCY